jgi:hypothetical protein
MYLFRFVSFLIAKKLGAPGLDFETGESTGSTYCLTVSANTCCAAATACP